MSDVACPDCGHGRMYHRSNIETSSTAVGDPVPCWAGVAAGEPCGCTRKPRRVE